MNTLAEIEQAVETLLPAEQEELFHFLVCLIGCKSSELPAADDPFDATIGAFAGSPGAAGRSCDDILYGTPVVIEKDGLLLIRGGGVITAARVREIEGGSR